MIKFCVSYKPHSLLAGSTLLNHKDGQPRPVGAAAPLHDAGRPPLPKPRDLPRLQRLQDPAVPDHDAAYEGVDHEAEEVEERGEVDDQVRVETNLDDVVERVDLGPEAGVLLAGHVAEEGPPRSADEERREEKRVHEYEEHVDGRQGPYGPGQAHHRQQPRLLRRQHCGARGLAEVRVVGDVDGVDGGGLRGRGGLLVAGAGEA
mmetsp:Transcript_27781/g.55523  ORF Transcript_27781/g.55523 Transcript_27781/m.55523 type:complete len:204 (-) Transcript_27781:296-907(-)